MNRKIVVSCVLALLAFVTVPLTAEDKPIVRFRAFAVNMNGGGRTNAGTVDIGITRWSTEAERDVLITTLRRSARTRPGADQEPESGFNKMPNTLAGRCPTPARPTCLTAGSARDRHQPPARIRRVSPSSPAR
jgi:hypothetical protein